MSNVMYDKGRQGFAEGSIAWLTDNIKAVLVDTGLYTPNFSSDQFLSDIPVGARISTSGNLASKTTTNGILDAADAAFSAVSGASVEAIAIYKDTGVASTSPLICYIDTATGLPFTPTGGNVTIIWDNGANKIFKL